MPFSWAPALCLALLLNFQTQDVNQKTHHRCPKTDSSILQSQWYHNSPSHPTLKLQQLFIPPVKFISRSHVSKLFCLNNISQIFISLSNPIITHFSFNVLWIYIFWVLHIRKHEQSFNVIYTREKTSVTTQSLFKWSLAFVGFGKDTQPC